MNLERKKEIRCLQRKIDKLIETPSNDSKNHDRLTFNRNFSHEIACQLTELNILQKQSKDGAQQSEFGIIEQVVRSGFHHNGGLHTGELDVVIVKASSKINGLDKAATNPINIARRVLSPASQRNIYHQIVNNQKNNVKTSKYKTIEYLRLQRCHPKRHF